MALFPRLVDCSHFHYENSGVCQFKVKVRDIDKGQFVISISSHENAWDTRRTWAQTVAMDEQFHECIISRATTKLPVLAEVPFLRPARSVSSLISDETSENRPLQRTSQSKSALEEEALLVDENRSELMKIVKDYFASFSGHTATPINCAPILNYFEMDNHGYRLTVPDEDVVNKPAIAAAQVIRRHVAQDMDEITLEVGGYVSIVDMPPDTPWWRGKLGIRVGFFPADCVSVIGGGGSVSGAGSLENGSCSEIGSYKEVALSKGKIISRLVWALFGKSRPTPLQLRRKGILRDRVFGCDLGVYLSAARREVPLPLMVCAQIIEDHGLVDGIYRRSGVQTHVQELRRYFDEDQRPTSDSDLITSDIHCFSSLLKIYFGELPTPLFNSAIYGLLSATLHEENEEQRLNTTFRVLSRLAPPYFRTARYLFVHLNKLSSYADRTLMTAKNLAICWAPNLMKPSRKIDYERPTPSLFTEVRENPLIVEYIITYARQLFSDRPPNWNDVVARKTAARNSCIAGLAGADADQSNLISLAEARRRHGCKSSITASEHEEGSVSKFRTRSVVESPRRNSFDIDDVFERSFAGTFPSGSPPMIRMKTNPPLPALQQKQNIVRQQKQRQANDRLAKTSGGRQRSRSFAEDETKRSSSPVGVTTSLVSEVRQEQAKRQKRLRLPFSPPTRLSRAKSSAGAVGGAVQVEPSSCQLGGSVFYLRANSMPSGEPNPPAPLSSSPSALPTPPLWRLSKDELVSGRSSLRSRVRERSASPLRSPDPALEKENVRSSFQRLQDSWQRRSARASGSPVLPVCSVSLPLSSSSSSSSPSSSSSSTPAASPRPGEGEEEEEEGQKTPTQPPASPPVLVRARAVPAHSSRCSTGSLPEYENLEAFRRSCGLPTPAQTAAEEPVSECKKRLAAELPTVRPKPRRSRLGTPQSALLQRNTPVRQSLPTRMDRMMTHFPTDMRCYLPETNV